MTIALNELWTGVAALATILLGVRINRWIPALAQYSIPPAVSGGLSIAVLLAVLGAAFDFTLTFGATLRNALLLIFFAALGLTAKFRRLKSGGAAVAGLCVLIAVLAVAQSAAGVAIASAFGLLTRGIIAEKGTAAPNVPETPDFASSSRDSCRCVVEAGWAARDS